VKDTTKVKLAEGQVPLFFPDEAERPPVEFPYLGPGVEREEIPERAGTALNHRWVHRVEGKARRGKHEVLGLFDESQRLFQTGGEFSQFIYWKLKLVTLPIGTWERIRNIADWIEIVDHEKNECWRISKGKFLKHAVRYNAGIGERIGASMRVWDVIDADGNIRQQGGS
jgi:hypothetical protein